MADKPSEQEIAVTRELLRQFDADPDVYFGVHGNYGCWLDTARDIIKVVNENG